MEDQDWEEAPGWCVHPTTAKVVMEELDKYCSTPKFCLTESEWEQFQLTLASLFDFRLRGYTFGQAVLASFKGDTPPNRKSPGRPWRGVQLDVLKRPNLKAEYEWWEKCGGPTVFTAFPKVEIRARSKNPHQISGAEMFAILRSRMLYGAWIDAFKEEHLRGTPSAYGMSVFHGEWHALAARLLPGGKPRLLVYMDFSSWNQHHAWRAWQEIWELLDPFGKDCIQLVLQSLYWGWVIHPDGTISERAGIKSGCAETTVLNTLVAIGLMFVVYGKDALHDYVTGRWIPVQYSDDNVQTLPLDDHRNFEWWERQFAARNVKVKGGDGIARWGETLPGNFLSHEFRWNPTYEMYMSFPCDLTKVMATMRWAPSKASPAERLYRCVSQLIRLAPDVAVWQHYYNKCCSLMVWDDPAYDDCAGLLARPYAWWVAHHRPLFEGGGDLAAFESLSLNDEIEVQAAAAC
jgi:hypothetical protein